VLNVVAVIVLTQALGFVGGAFGTAIGYGVYAVLIYYLSRRRESPFPWAVPWRTLGCAILAACAAAATWAVLAPVRVSDVLELLWLAAAGLAGLVVYGIVLALLGELPFSPRDVARRGLAGVGNLRTDEATSDLR
jgi:peptidoglycan biosynthesis protein MviN/MurJ (putative lipid II flippase)